MKRGGHRLNRHDRGSVEIRCEGEFLGRTGDDEMMAPLDDAGGNPEHAPSGVGEVVRHLDRSREVNRSLQFRLKPSRGISAAERNAIRSIRVDAQRSKVLGRLELGSGGGKVPQCCGWFARREGHKALPGGDPIGFPRDPDRCIGVAVLFPVDNLTFPKTPNIASNRSTRACLVKCRRDE